jgi:hypothetical protein
MLDTRSFVDQKEVPSVGFTLTDDSLMANLDVMYAGVSSCSMLEVRIKYRADILTFVLACQSAHGGFSRAPIALPDLEMTHRALRVIALTAPEVLSGRSRVRT